jgi:hypothetical protein
MTEEKRGSNPNSKEALEKSRAATQFNGERANPQSQEIGTKPWSIRNSMRYLARQEIDQADPQAFKKMLPPKPTIAQVIAANALAKATKADMRAVEFATDQIDGKLAQATLNADLSSVVNSTDEQLYEIIEKFTNATSNNSPDGSGGSVGASEADGGEETIS